MNSSGGVILCIFMPQLSRIKTITESSHVNTTKLTLPMTGGCWNDASKIGSLTGSGMQISNRSARMVLMLRLISAQPFAPLFPPSYPLPNRICRISQSYFSQETGMSEHWACCLPGHVHVTFPQIYRKRCCCSHILLFSTPCVATA